MYIKVLVVDYDLDWRAWFSPHIERTTWK